MKMKMALSLVAGANLILSGITFAAGAKTYQVTGTVVAATGSMVTVQKGAEKFEIDIDPATTKGSALIYNETWRDTRCRVPNLYAVRAGLAFQRGANRERSRFFHNNHNFSTQLGLPAQKRLCRKNP